MLQNAVAAFWPSGVLKSGSPHPAGSITVVAAAHPGASQLPDEMSTSYAQAPDASSAGTSASAFAVSSVLASAFELASAVSFAYPYAFAFASAFAPASAPAFASAPASASAPRVAPPHPLATAKQINPQDPKKKSREGEKEGFMPSLVRSTSLSSAAPAFFFSART
jgi:hypothetical protein